MIGFKDIFGTSSPESGKESGETDASESTENQEGAPKTILESLQEASELTDKSEIYEALTPELGALIKSLDYRAYLTSKIAVLLEKVKENGWENMADIDIQAVNDELEARIKSGEIQSTEGVGSALGERLRDED